jgi:hypothetical protein
MFILLLGQAGPRRRSINFRVRSRAARQNRVGPHTKGPQKRRAETVMRTAEEMMIDGDGLELR